MEEPVRWKIMIPINMPTASNLHMPTNYMHGIWALLVLRKSELWCSVYIYAAFECYRCDGSVIYIRNLNYDATCISLQHHINISDNVLFNNYGRLAMVYKLRTRRQQHCAASVVPELVQVNVTQWCWSMLITIYVSDSRYGSIMINTDGVLHWYMLEVQDVNSVLLVSTWLSLV